MSAFGKEEKRVVRLHLFSWYNTVIGVIFSMHHELQARGCGCMVLLRMYIDHTES